MASSSWRFSPWPSEADGRPATDSRPTCCRNAALSAVRALRQALQPLRVRAICASATLPAALKEEKNCGTW